MMATSRRAEEGQAAVFITLLLMFALIALAALAIDGGHLYLVRRDLQNVADAACLAAATELSLRGTADDAHNAAVEYIVANGGDADLYTPQAGDGVDLVKGIQVSGADVRVAVQTLVDTYFTRMFNRSQAAVGARAHCNAVAAGGLLPIAVRRYEYNEDETEQLDLMANKGCKPETSGCYYHDASTHDEHTWNGRYGLMKVHLPKDTYTPRDGGKTDGTTGNLNCDVPPKDGDTEGLCVLGDGVGTNDGTADFRGFILFDVRNLVPGPVEYHNGATGQADTNKEISQQYFHSGYQGPLPQVGDQLAMLDGISNDFAPQEMSKYWNEGDEFAAIVYSGFVWNKPDLEVTIEPVINPDLPKFVSAANPATYTVTLEKVGPEPWHADATFELEASFMELGGAYGEIAPVVEFDDDEIELPQGQESESVDMVVYATNPITPTAYVSALTVRARETTLGVKRWASTSFRYGYHGPDFTAYTSALEFSVPQGGSLDIPITTRGLNVQNPQAPTWASPIGYGWESVFLPGQSDSIRIRDDKNTTSSVTLHVRDDAAVGSYPVVLTVNEVETHSVQFAVNVYQPVPGGEPTRFIIVEGFALYRISYVDENTIAAYAIGEIVDDPSEFISGLNPRLLPWVAQ